MSLRTFPKLDFVSDREKYLTDLCRGKVVLHLGCASNLALEEQVATGRHLHTVIRSSARRVYGVDIDEKAVRSLRERHKVADLFVADVERLDLDFPEPIDVILAGEVIEHLYNPGNFLNSVSRYMGEQTTLLITTPNLLCAKTFLHSLVGTERIHPDHTIGFTFSLLQTLLERHEYIKLDWMTTVERFASRRNRFFNIALLPLFKMSPRYAETIMVTARHRQPAPLEAK